METIKKSIGQGWGKGELYAALAYNADDKYGGLAIKQVRFNPESGSTAIIIGDSTTAITLATYAQRAISIYTTSASTDGSNTVLPVYINATMSATGGVGRAFEARLNVTGKLGGWGNAIKGYIDLTGGTGTSGLASAICAEMKMSASATLGTFGVLELELVCPSSWVAHDGIGTNSNSFIYAQVSGNTKGEFDDHGYLFNIQGLTSGTTHLLYNNTLKCAIGSTKWYIPLSSAQASYTTAYPIVVSGVTTGITISGAGTNALTITQTGSAATDGYALKLGTSGTHLTTATADACAIRIYADTTSATGDNRGIYNRFYIKTAGAGGGESLRSYTEIVNVATGTAHGAHLSLGMGESTDGGAVTGLGAAVRCTLGLPDVALASGGTYTALMSEIYSFGDNSDAGLVTELSFLRVVNDGTTNGKATVDDDAFLFVLDGFADGAAHLYYVHAPTTLVESIRVKTPGGTRYIGLYSTP